MKIFVSHAHDDAPALSQMKKLMGEYDINLFLAHEDINIGENDLNRIKAEISDCDEFLFIGNRKSKESDFCNQELGFALGKNKPILSVVSSEMTPWGFIGRQQAIKYREIGYDLFNLLHEQFIKREYASDYIKYKKRASDKLGESINIYGFLVNKTKSNYINLIPDNWNDFGYITSFTMNYRGQEMGWVKIGFMEQTSSNRTVDSLPREFKFLSKRYISCINYNEKYDLQDADKNNLYILLNDINHGVNEETSNKFRQTEVVNISILREG